jgi:hypothetical protein
MEKILKEYTYTNDLEQEITEVTLENGTVVKKTLLSDGRILEVYPLKWKDQVQIQRLSGDDSEKMVFAMAAAACKIDGKSLPLEDFQELDYMDGVLIQSLFIKKKLNQNS